MTRPTPTPARPRKPRKPRKPRDRGSIMLLVIVTIVLMVIIGATWLQVTRVQRLSIGDQEFYGPVALDSAKERIMLALKEDVFSKDQFFLFNEARGHEPYDYPFTRSTAQGGGTGTEFDLDGTAIGGVPDGDLSDRWLAWTTPSFIDGVPRWRHITSLTGLRYVESGGGSSDLSLVTTTNPLGVAALTPGADGFHDIPLDDDSLVDTDGDGLGDAMWERVPTTPVINGIEYFMAVRIVDLSSMVNLKVATAVDNVSAWNVAGSGRGYFPTDANALTLFGMRAGNDIDGSANTTAGYDDLGWLLGGRTGATPPQALWPLATPAYPTPVGVNATGGVPLGTGSRAAAWLEDVRESHDLTRWSPTALELLWRGGLDSPNTAAVEQELRESRANMATPMDEASHVLTLNDSSGTPLPPYTAANTQYPMPLDPNAAGFATTVENHFHGGPEATAPSARTKFYNIRHMVTATSGSSVVAPNYGWLNIVRPPYPAGSPVTVEQEGGFALKQDMIYDNAANPQLRASWYRERLERIFEIPNHLPDGSPDPAPGTGYGGTDDSANRAAAEFALNIQEYSDSNGTIDTFFEFPSTNRIRYGLETLPFLREVYAQLAYEDPAALADGVWEPVQPAAFNPLDPTADSAAMVIEIGNPFDTPIAINNGTTGPTVRVAIYQLVGGNFVLQSAWQPPATTIAPRDPTGAAAGAEHLLIVSNPAQAMQDTEGAQNAGTVRVATYADLVVELGLPGTPVVAPVGSLRFQPGLPIIVALETQVNGIWAAYDRLYHTDFFMPDTVGSVGTPRPFPPASLAEEAHVQMSLKRAGEGIRYLSNVGKGVEARDYAGAFWPDDTFRADPDSTVVDPTDDPVDDLNADAKSDGTGPIVGDAVTFGAADNLFQIPMANRNILSVSELGQIFMFGFADGFNPETFSIPPNETNPAAVPPFAPPVDTIVGQDVDFDGDGFPDGDFVQRFSGNGPAAVADPLNPAGSLPQGAHMQPSNERFLDFAQDPTAAIGLNVLYYPGPVAVEHGLNYAQMVMDQFTTLSPRFDGVNNDGNGGPDEGGSPTVSTDMPEQLVPGTFNINTAPWHVITFANPLAEPINTAEALTHAITRYRDDTGAGSDRAAMYTALGMTSGRTLPGIKSIGELMWVADGTPFGTTILYGVDGASQAAPAGGAQDLYPLPESRVANGGTAEAYAIQDDAEERLARFQYFPQVFSTRSDVYAAYIVIRGYRTGRFNEGPVETLRAIAIFDRSGLWGGTAAGGGAAEYGEVQMVEGWATDPKARKLGWNTYPVPQ